MVECLVESNNKKGIVPCNHTHEAPLTEEDIKENMKIIEKQREESVAARERQQNLLGSGDYEMLRDRSLK